ncbi:class I SAM-dependent methyltransferase [Bernardetia sp. ABR2-2B]|uniref:class I SAM-dependent methyltransferase n=1 Tax=Bernardetia sp. ABR2-2B TaxID=3127472 RepID=UPI0030D2986C
MNNKKVKNVKAYTGTRPDIIKQLSTPKKVLDVGCNEGALGESIKSLFSESHVTGIDYNSEAIEIAKNRLDEAYTIDLENENALPNFLENKEFDTIICADVLEHIRFPWKVVEELYNHLSENGKIIISLPNFGFWESFFHLLNQKLPMRDRGIYDDTHLRFFMRKNLPSLAPKNATFKIAARNYRLKETGKTPLDGIFIPVLNKLPLFRDLITFQFIITIEK